MFDQDKTQVRRVKYFSRPPWRSYHFLVSTLVLLMVTFFPIEIIMDFRLVGLSPIQFTHSRLSPNTSEIWPMFTPLIALIILWVRLWKAHNDVYEAVHFTSVEKLTEDARIAVPLDALAYMLYSGFNLASFAVFLSYGVTADFFKASLHR